MKVNVKTQEVTFNPINIELTIESKAELLSLWAALNSSTSTLRKNSCNYESVAKCADSSLVVPFWKAINEITDDLNLKA